MQPTVTLATVGLGTRIALDPDSGIVFPLTRCCGASAKGVERGVACRSCYQQIDDDMASAWVFVQETTDAAARENIVQKHRLERWLTDHAVGSLAPTMAYTILLEALRRGRKD